MSKAYSEQRQIAPGEADQLQVAAGIGRAARAGREDDEGLAAYRDIEGTARLDMAPHHLHASPQPLETLGEIEAEAVEMRSEEHTSELQSLMRISYAVLCLKKKNITTTTHI